MFWWGNRDVVKQSPEKRGRKTEKQARPWVERVPGEWEGRYSVTEGNERKDCRRNGKIKEKQKCERKDADVVHNAQ